MLLFFNVFIEVGQNLYVIILAQLQIVCKTKEFC